MTRTGTLIALLGTAGALGLAGQEPLVPQVVSPHLPAADTIIATLILAPVAGEEDCGPRLQAAIDRVGKAGGGVVFLAQGTYPLRQPLVVREGVTLRGEWAPPDRGVRGTVLAVEDRPGTTEAPDTIALERGSGLRELALWYPRQRPESVTPYPWAVGTSEARGGDNITLMNVTLVNPYRGIRIGPDWNELHTIRQVHMTPLETGLAVDTTTDIGRLNGVVLSPRVWEQSRLPDAPAEPTRRQALRDHLARNATGLDIGRSDWEYIIGVQAENLATGIRFRPGKQGTTNAVMLACAFRQCGTAILLERLNGVGLSATACEFSGDRAVHGAASFDTVAQFNTCTLSGTTAAVLMAGPGLVSGQNCRLEGRVEAASGQLSLVDCDLAKATPALVLGEAVSRVRLLGCRMADPTAIENRARDADCAISHLPTGSTPLKWAPHPPAPPRGPRTAALVSVTSLGASPDLPDNTAAFQAALDEAGRAGGGTVYVPAGNYRFAGHLKVPAGTELRGIFDVPHHTISAGSVLMPTEGRKDEGGTPFLSLDAGSGLRGLTVWYPEQPVTDPVPYPWTVRSLGPGCWLEDVTLGNAWQGVDFGTHSSDGHVIRYLAGACFRRGLWVSKCESQGWVEDLQFNPHYALRLHPSLPHPPLGAGDAGGKVIDVQRKQLEGMVFGSCRQEHIFATFLYAAFDGLAFRDDRGGTQGRVLVHGTDTASRALAVGKVGQEGIELVNAQLVPLGKWVQSAIVTERDFAGSVRLFNSQVWAGPSTAVLDGRGEVLLQQMNTLSGPIEVRGGTVRLEGVTFGQDLAAHVKVGPKAGPVTLLGCLGLRGPLRWQAEKPGTVRALANSASLRPQVAPGGTRAALAKAWADMRPLANTLAEPGGGRKNVADATCVLQTLDDPAPGSRVVRLSGRVEDPAYAYCYFRLVEGPFSVQPDSVLRCRIKPLTEAGRNTSIDALFASGAPLRDRGLTTRDGLSVHPSGAKGKVGEWRAVEIPLGALAGQTLQALLVGFDGRDVSGEVGALFEGVSLASELGTDAWQVAVTPAGGAARRGAGVTLTGPAPRIRYTLDGSNPQADSRLYAAPIVLAEEGVVEVRCCAESAEGKLSPIVFSTLYDVR